MADIASKAGVAKGTLYLHFTDKESLFRATIAEVCGEALDQIEGQFVSMNTATEQLRLLVQVAIEFMDRFPHYLETLHDLDGNPPRQEDEPIRQRRERLFYMIEDRLREANDRGEIEVSHPSRSAMALLGMLHRVMQGTPRPWPEDLADWATDHFLYGTAASIAQQKH